MTEKQFLDSLTTDTRFLLGLQSMFLESKKTLTDLSQFLSVSHDEALAVALYLLHTSEKIDRLYGLNVCDSCD